MDRFDAFAAGFVKGAAVLDEHYRKVGKKLAEMMAQGPNPGAMPSQGGQLSMGAVPPPAPSPQPPPGPAPQSAPMFQNQPQPGVTGSAPTQGGQPAAVQTNNPKKPNALASAAGKAPPPTLNTPSVPPAPANPSATSKADLVSTPKTNLP